MNKRKITEKQEQALRLCHHEFGGLTQAEAAEKMGITQPALSELLAAVKKVMPEWFPILTKFEAKCYHIYIDEGFTIPFVAVQVGKSQSAVYDALKRTRAKGQFFPEAKRKVLQYNPSMHDNQIKQKF